MPDRDAANRQEYRTIVADPPWDHSDGYAIRRGYANAKDGGVEALRLPYGVMTLDEIRALGVSELCHPDGARLFLWTTNRYLRDAFDVLGAWRFTFKQTLVWHKPNASPFSGSVAHSSAEFVLVGTRGSVPILRKMPSSVLTFGHKHEHSRKPDLWLDWIEQVSPGPYLEMFARRNRLGWDTWGNEALEHVELAS